jgi:plasmid stabilization system protein ParE
VDAYMIYYRVREDEVQILRVVHAARDAGALSLDG